jgi:hypothetical protein
MRRSVSLILILGCAATLAACATEPRHRQFRPGMGMRHGGGPGGPGGPGGFGMGRGLFVSPAGEPFRRSEGGPEPMRAWFDQADSDHDGALTWPEFEADFVRYFAVLDADHDGEIGPDEVAHYESSIFPEMASRGYGGGAAMGGSPGTRGGGMGRGRGGMGGGRGGMGGMRGGGMRQGGGRPGGGGMAMMAGAARFGLLPISHPIMDADTDFNRGVSLAEFRQAAAHRFAMLNTGNTGRLAFPQLVQIRAQAMHFRVGPAEPQTEEERRAAIPVPGGD